MITNTYLYRLRRFIFNQVNSSSKKKQLLVMPKQKMLNSLGSNNKKENSNNIPSNHHHHHNQQSKSILIRTSPIKIPLFKNTTPIRHHSTSSSIPTKPHIKLTEKQHKDNFMKLLGLVTKEALVELQTKRNERKRRTTANPQFSNAALEAKRIQNQELAERRAKRRLLISSNNTSSTHSYNLKRSSNLNNNNNNNSNNNSSSNLNGSINKNNVNINTKSMIPTTMIAHISDGTMIKPITIERQEMSSGSGLHLVINLNGNQNANCYDCQELCETDCDSVLFCKYCRSLFHATCLVSLKDLIKNANSLKCAKCEKKRKQLDDELSGKVDLKKKMIDEKKDWDDKVNKMRLQLKCLKDRLIIQQKIDKLCETIKMIKETDIEIGLCIIEI